MSRITPPFEGQNCWSVGEVFEVLNVHYEDYRIDTTAMPLPCILLACFGGRKYCTDIKSAYPKRTMAYQAKRKFVAAESLVNRYCGLLFRMIVAFRIIEHANAVVF